MADLIKALDEKRQVALALAREIAERAVAGEEKAEDEEAYKRANADFDRNSGLLHDEQKRVAAEAETASAFASAAAAAGLHQNQERHDDVPVGDKWLVEARAALAGETRGKGGTDERMPKFVQMRNAFGMPEMRLVGYNLGSPGGETVQETLSSTLFRKVFDDSAILSAGVRVFHTTGGERVKFPRLTSRGPLTQVNARVAEQGQIQKSVAGFDQVSFDAYKYGHIAQADREVIQDSVINIQGLMGELIGTNIAEYLGYDLTLGTGTGMPKGVVNLIPVGNLATATAGKAGVIQNSDELLDIIWKLKPAYRRNGKFLMNDLTVLTFRKMKYAVDGHYVFEAGLAGKPDTLLGYPLLTDPNVVAQGTTAKSIVFADFDKYWVRMVADLRVEWSTEYAWDTDLVSVKGVLRADGDAIDDTAFAGYVGAAT